jgi:hypothetical protein
MSWYLEKISVIIDPENILYAEEKCVRLFKHSPLSVPIVCLRHTCLGVCGPIGGGGGDERGAFGRPLGVLETPLLRGNLAAGRVSDTQNRHDRDI